MHGVASKKSPKSTVDHDFPIFPLWTWPYSECPGFPPPSSCDHQAVGGGSQIADCRFAQLRQSRCFCKAFESNAPSTWCVAAKKSSMKGAFKLSNRVSKNKKKHPKTCAESREMRLMEGLGVSSSQIGAFPSLAFLFPRTEFRVLDGFLAYGNRKSRPLDSPQCMSYANPSWNS